MAYLQLPGARYITETSCEFIVWAPFANSVQLIITSPEPKIFSLEEEKAFYWRIIVENCTPGSKYFIKTDDSVPLADPASLSQPFGVFGPSETVRLDNEIWEDEQWGNIPLEKLIIYELHIGTFTPEGTLNGVVSKLDYLCELGINAIEIMPLAQFSGLCNWGYDGVFPFAVQNNYGGANELIRLVNECHKRGIAVILDVVYNHLGPEGSSLNRYAPFLTNKYSTPWGKAINFDGRLSFGIRNYFIKNALMWLSDFHIDGLRIDAVDAIYDSSEIHFIEELADAVKDLKIKSGKEHYLIGEINSNETKFLLSKKSGHAGLDAQWNDDFHHSLHSKITGEKKGYYIDFSEPDCFSKVLSEVFYLDGRFSKFHNKKTGKPAGKLPGSKFVVYAQNHDQVGNRKYGERLINLTGFEKQKLIAGLLLLSPYIPMLFMGEEYGETNPFLFFIDFSNPKLNSSVKKGREKELNYLGFKASLKGSDPANSNTFLSSKLEWDLREKNDSSAMLFRYYRFLIETRKTHEVFKQTNRENMHVIEMKKLMIIKRWQGNQSVLVFANFSKKQVRVAPDVDNEIHRIIDSSDIQWGGKGSLCPEILKNNGFIRINPESIVIYSTE